MEKLLVFIKRTFSLLLFCLSHYCYGISQELIHEGFDNGTIAPLGWTINVDTVYSSSSSTGEKPPALKFGIKGENFETSEFTKPTECSFWSRGYSLDSLSSLIIDFKTNGNWYNLDTLRKLSNSIKTTTIQIPDSAIKLKFTFLRSKGTLAFDDFIVRRITNTNTTIYFDSLGISNQEAPAIVDSISKTILIKLHSTSKITNLALLYKLPQNSTISPNPSTIKDYTKPVKYSLKSDFQITPTEWTVIAEIDKAPSVLNVKYSNENTESIQISFDEKIHVCTDSGKIKPIIKLTEYNDTSKIEPVNATFSTDSIAIIISPISNLKFGTKYQLNISSVMDTSYNVMPNYKWNFISTNNTNIPLTNKNCSTFTMWPNPANNILNISPSCEYFGLNLNYSITNILGMCFQKGKIMNSSITTININNIPGGLYCITIKYADQIILSDLFVKKLIK